MSTRTLQTCSSCTADFQVADPDPLCQTQCPNCGTLSRLECSLNQFQLLEVLAVGGMGTVYKALDVHLRRQVALKVLRHKYSGDSEFIVGLKREAQVTAAIDHPNVVKIYSFGSVENDFYIAMELVDKGTLEDRLHNSGRLTDEAALQIGMQVASGLRAAAGRGLLHRDVKPGNILFADANTAKITDFSLPMFTEKKNGEEAETWGTPHYIAPEKLRNEPEDVRSDIYSLGVTLYHALAGRPIYDGADSIEIARQHLTAEVPHLRECAAHVSPETAATIHKMLAKEPSRRFQNYDELLATFQQDLASSAKRHTQGRRRKRHRVRRPDCNSWAVWSGTLF